MRFCQDCGYECDENMKFCPNCGSKLVAMKDNRPTTNKSVELNETQNNLQVENKIELDNQEQTIKNDNQNQTVQQKDSDKCKSNLQSEGVVIDIPQSQVDKKQEQHQNVKLDTPSMFFKNLLSNFKSNQDNTNNEKPQWNKYGFSIASIVVSVIAIIYGIMMIGALMFMGLSGSYVVSLILGMVGIVLAVLGMKNAKWLSIVGIVINSVVLFTSILIIIFGSTIKMHNYNNKHFNYYDYYEEFFDEFDGLF